MILRAPGGGSLAHGTDGRTVRAGHLQDKPQEAVNGLGFAANHCHGVMPLSVPPVMSAARCSPARAVGAGDWLFCHWRANGPVVSLSEEARAPGLPPRRRVAARSQICRPFSVLPTSAALPRTVVCVCRAGRAGAYRTADRPRLTLWPGGQSRSPGRGLLWFRRWPAGNRQTPLLAWGLTLAEQAANTGLLQCGPTFIPHGEVTFPEAPKSSQRGAFASGSRRPRPVLLPGPATGPAPMAAIEPVHDDGIGGWSSPCPTGSVGRREAARAGTAPPGRRGPRGGRGHCTGPGHRHSPAGACPALRRGARASTTADTGPDGAGRHGCGGRHRGVHGCACPSRSARSPARAGGAASRARADSRLLRRRSDHAGRVGPAGRVRVQGGGSAGTPGTRLRRPGGQGGAAWPWGVRRPPPGGRRHTRRARDHLCLPRADHGRAGRGAWGALAGVVQSPRRAPVGPPR